MGEPLSGLALLAALATLGSFSHDAAGRSNKNADVEIVPVKPSVYLIAGAGANIVVQTGPDGVIVVDSGTIAMARQGPGGD